MNTKRLKQTAAPAQATPHVPRKHGSRRAQIIAVAKQLFATNGFQATSLRDIGIASGILPGSLYHHFKTKDEILDVIVRQFSVGLLQAYEEVVATTSNSRLALEGLVKAGIEECVREQEAHTILVYEVIYMSKNPMFSYLDDTLQAIQQVWFGVLQEGVRNGTFRRPSSLQLTVRVLVNSINGTATSWPRAKGRYSLDELIAVQLEVLEAGLILPSTS